MARLPYSTSNSSPREPDPPSRNINLYRPLVNSPAWRARSTAWARLHPPQERASIRASRELAIPQVGWMTRSEYEFTHHVKIGRVRRQRRDIRGMKPPRPRGRRAAWMRTCARCAVAREMVNNLAMAEATFAEILHPCSRPST